LVTAICGNIMPQKTTANKIDVFAYFTRWF